MKIDATTVTVELEEQKIDKADAAPSLFVNVMARPELGLDRQHVYGWSVGQAGSAKAQQLAARLSAAVLAGKVFSGGADVRRDINGRTYLSAAGCMVMGRYMNADLRRVGF